MTIGVSLDSAIEEFLAIYLNKGADKTAHAYRAALRKFTEVLKLNHIPTTTTVNQINFNLIYDFIALLQDKDSEITVATEKLYLTAFRQFVSFLSAEEYAEVPVIRILEKIKRLRRTEGRRIPDVDIGGYRGCSGLWKTIRYLPAQAMTKYSASVRDRALIFFLAEAGLRIEEACKLRRQNINWSANQARIIGKRDKEAVVRLSTRSLEYLREYLAARQDLDGVSGKALQALPSSPRHDLGAGKRISAITTTTGRAIIEKWVEAAGLMDLTSPITPHSLRHYFVNHGLRSHRGPETGAGVGEAKSTETTERYTHLVNPKLDKAYALPLRIDKFFSTRYEYLETFKFQ